MPRKSIVELIAQATADFPDNVAGLITPVKLRTWAIDFLTSIAPAYGYLTKANPSPQTLGLTPALITFTGAVDSDPSQTTSTVPASTIARAEKGLSTFQFSANIETSNGRFITFTIYKNGVATTWSITGNGGGNGNPVAVAMSAIDYEPVAGAVYDVRGTAEVNGTSVIIDNAVFLLSVEPVRSFT
jgi:hypothetical protein